MMKTPQLKETHQKLKIHITDEDGMKVYDADHIVLLVGNYGEDLEGTEGISQQMLIHGRFSTSAVMASTDTLIKHMREFRIEHERKIIDQLLGEHLSEEKIRELANQLDMIWRDRSEV